MLEEEFFFIYFQLSNFSSDAFKIILPSQDSQHCSTAVCCTQGEVP